MKKFKSLKPGDMVYVFEEKILPGKTYCIQRIKVLDVDKKNYFITGEIQEHINIGKLSTYVHRGETTIYIPVNEFNTASIYVNKSDKMVVATNKGELLDRLENTLTPEVNSINRVMNAVKNLKDNNDSGELNESLYYNSGWDLDDLIKKCPELNTVMNMYSDVAHELQSCTRGSFTEVTTYNELSDVFETLGKLALYVSFELKTIEEKEE